MFGGCDAWLGGFVTNPGEESGTFVASQNVYLILHYLGGERGAGVLGRLT